MRTGSAPTVLVAESDERLVEALVGVLGQKGFELYLAHDGPRALAIHEVVRPDVVLASVGLPGLSGLEVCAELRHQTDTPIVLMGTATWDVDPVTAFEAGADDFVADPSRVREVAARTEAVLRRVTPVAGISAEEQILTVGDVRLDQAGLEVTVGGRQVPMSVPHFRLLEVLIKNAGHVMTTDDLARAGAGDEPFRPDSVRNKVRHLRRLLGLGPSGQSRITVARGRGYMYELPEGTSWPIGAAMRARRGLTRVRRNGVVAATKAADRSPRPSPASDNGELPTVTSPEDQAPGPTGECARCADCAAAERGSDSWAVARLTTGYVRLNPVQHYRGATLFVAKACVGELHELSDPVRVAHLAEMAQVAEALSKAFRAERLSYEAPGHVGEHLHWWLTPRYADDPYPRGSIWLNPDFLRSYWAGAPEPGGEVLETAKRCLRDALEAQSLTIESSYVD